MPAIDLSVLCIPVECDNIKLRIECEIASRWDANLLCDICRHFASVISHNLRCIPAYAHQIPTGFFSIITKLSQGQLVYHLPKHTPPHNPWDLPPTKKISRVRSVWAQENTKPHTIREIYHPQKNQWDPWDLCEPKKRSVIFPPGVPQRRQIYLLHDRWSRGVRWWWL